MTTGEAVRRRAAASALWMVEEGWLVDTLLIGQNAPPTFLDIKKIFKLCHDFLKLNNAFVWAIFKRITYLFIQLPMSMCV